MKNLVLALALLLGPLPALAQNIFASPAQPYMSPDQAGEQPSAFPPPSTTTPSQPATPIPSATTTTMAPVTNTPITNSATLTPPTTPTTVPTLTPPGTLTPPTTALAPFGESLFTNYNPPSNLAPNPDYIIQPGDTVSIEIYGGETAQVSAVVDTQGNVFLPSFGPVHVAGVTAANLQATVQHQIANAFTSNVNVYAVLETETSISIYVTGYVRDPGQYLGSSTDSVLDFLSRAGGIDPVRGSYRDILILRHNHIIQSVDLYEFLINGTGIAADLETGDTILVGKQEPIVAASGAVRNNYLFELPHPDSAGRSILRLAQPLPSATDALITGTRDGQPFSKYVTLAELRETPLYDQDQLTFIADVPPPTITVQVQGSRIGPSVLVASRDTNLKQVLNYIAVDPTDADVKSIYIIRPSLAAAQAAAIQAAIDRLQKALFYATSLTTGEAQIRASEAQQIQNYINNARNVQPDGILVVDNAADVMSDIRLEDGDIIVIPETSDTVMVDGEVETPGAIRFDATATRADYVNQAGGFTERGRPGNIIIRRASGCLVLDPNAPIMPGDEIIVLPYVETDNFVITQDVFGLLYQLAASTYYASKL